jgi:transposase InsO family protein
VVAPLARGGSCGALQPLEPPAHQPDPDLPETEQRVLALRRERRLGPARIAGILELPPSTVHHILTRHAMPRLAWLDRPTGTPVRYEWAEPLRGTACVEARTAPRRGGSRMHGRTSAIARSNKAAGSRGELVGHEFVHSAVHGHSRLVYCEVLSDEQATTAVAFWTRAQAFFTAHSITVQPVLTDNGACYRSRRCRDELNAASIVHKRTRPYRPRTNGTVERLNRTLLTEWAYARPFTSGQERAPALPAWLHGYNQHRAHTSHGGRPSITRAPVNDSPGTTTRR